MERPASWNWGWWALPSLASAQPAYSHPDALRAPSAQSLAWGHWAERKPGAPSALLSRMV